MRFSGGTRHENAGNCRRASPGVRAQESRTLANFHRNLKEVRRCPRFWVGWQRSEIRSDFREGEEDSNFSVFRVRRFSEWPEPLHWIAFPVEILTKPLIHWIASPLFTENPFFHWNSSHPLPKNQVRWKRLVIRRLRMVWRWYTTHLSKLGTATMATCATSFTWVLPVHLSFYFEHNRGFFSFSPRWNSKRHPENREVGVPQIPHVRWYFPN